MRSSAPARRLAACLVAFASALGVAAVGSVADHGVVAAGNGSPSAFEPVGPLRLADTRKPDCRCEVGVRTTRVGIGGVAGLPADVSAAAVTITVTAATDEGFATVFPSGEGRPVASTVNYPAVASTANSTIVRVGVGGAIDVYTSTDADVIVDVTGVFTAADEATSGRFVSVPPQRILDGRTSGAAVGSMAPGSSATIPLPPSVPADATAVAVNVTSIDAHRPGYLVGYAAGAQPPATSFLNVDGSGTPVAAAVILPVSSTGLAITNTAGGRLLIDLTGYFTGPSARSSTDGLFVATTPTRLLDTRSGDDRLWRDGTIEVAAPFSNAAALATNVTMVGADEAGFTTAYPAGVARPDVSAVNSARPDHTIPNAAITPMSTRGVGYHASTNTDLLVDLNGYFLGTPVAATEPVPTNERPRQRVLLVGDSTLAVIRNMTQTQELFHDFDAIVDAQGCRRLVWPSCLSDTDFRIPNTVEEAIVGTPGEVDVVVVMAGYNDWNDPFGEFVATIMNAARSKGAEQVVWLTFSVGHPPKSSPKAIAAYAENTRDLWAAAPWHPDLVVADWRTYNSRSVGWMAPRDGVHLDPLGGWGLADYLARWIAHLDDRPCHAPLTPGGPIPDPCPNPDRLPHLPDVAALYGV